MLSTGDINDIKQGMYDLYEEVFSHNIEFMQYDEVNNAPDDGYKERKYKKFLESVLLIGNAKLDLGPEELKDSGMTRKFNATFAVPTLALENTGILYLEVITILKSRIKYNGVTYKIVDFTPEVGISDTYMRYSFKGKALKNGEY